MLKRKYRFFFVALAVVAGIVGFSLHFFDGSKIKVFQTTVVAQQDTIQRFRKDSVKNAKELSTERKINQYLKASLDSAEAKAEFNQTALDAQTQKTETYKKKCRALEQSNENLAKSYGEEKSKREAAENKVAILEAERGEIVADVFGYKKESQAKSDTIDIARRYLATNLAVFVAGFDLHSCQKLYSYIQDYLPPLCEGQFSFVWGPDGNRFRSTARRLGGLSLDALYRFLEARSFNIEDPSYKDIKRQLSDIIKSGDFIRWSRIMGCDAATAEVAKAEISDILKIN